METEELAGRKALMYVREHQAFMYRIDKPYPQHRRDSDYDLYFKGFVSGMKDPRKRIPYRAGHAPGYAGFMAGAAEAGL